MAWAELLRLVKRCRSSPAGETRSLDGYRAEFVESGLLETIDQARREFQKSVSGSTSRGHPYGFGSIREDVGAHLYALLRRLRPRVAVETGVCNGVSKAIILAALDRNGMRQLCSIDFPEFAETRYPDGAFWEGKKGAVVPKGKEPGWIVPQRPRRRSALIRGRSKDKLGPLLDRLGGIDFLFHDGEHSPECMRFECHTVWPHLRPGGILGSDDVAWNSASEDLSRDYARESTGSATTWPSSSSNENHSVAVKGPSGCAASDVEP